MHRCCYMLLCFITVMQVVLANPTRTSISTRSKCRRWLQYYDKESGKCRKCSTCPSGRGIRQPCTEYSDAECEACVKGSTYSTRRSQFGSPCYQCDTCGERSTLKKCTPKRNTVCGSCPLGSYWDSIWSECRKCSYCYNGIRSAHATVVMDCMKEEIPQTYWCAYMKSPPYPVPALRDYIASNGTVVFYTENIAQKAHNENIKTEESEDKITMLTEAQHVSTEEMEVNTSAYSWTDDEDYVQDVIIDQTQVSGSQLENAMDNTLFVVSVSLIVFCAILICANCAFAMYLYKKKDARSTYKPIYTPPTNRTVPSSNRAGDKTFEKGHN